MATTTFTTAGEIINRAAAECGFAPVVDPLQSTDAKFQQMKYLLDTAGEELCIAHPWEWLITSATIDESTTRNSEGGFEIPDDYYYLVPQTGWDTDKRLPIGGPLTAQEWTYIIGRDLATSTLFTSFRLFGGLFYLYPDPPQAPDTFTFTYEYINKNWVLNEGDEAPKDSVENSGDIVRMDRTLVTRYLKLKYLEASGFDTAKAQADFNQMFDFLTGKDKSAKVLNAGGNMGAFPYLTWRNVPFTDYGLS